MALNLCFSHFHVFLNLIICSFTSSADEEDEIILNVESHYAQAKVGNFVLDIGDCVFVKVNFISLLMSCYLEPRVWFFPT